jgi:hypothetical protein
LIRRIESLLPGSTDKVGPGIVPSRVGVLILRLAPEGCFATRLVAPLGALAKNGDDDRDDGADADVAA